MPIKALILAAILFTGAPWEKNTDKVEPEVTGTVSTAVIETAPEADTTSVTAPAVTPSPQGESWNVLESCTITHYCNCARCCGSWAGGPTASGVMPESGRTVAVDKSVIPLGSEVLIDGVTYIAEDTGVSGHHIDIFCDSHQEALERGMYTTEIAWR